MKVKPNTHYAECLKNICENTARKLSVDSEKEGHETIKSTNEIILLQTNQNYIINRRDTDRYLITTDNEIELFSKPYRAVMLLAHDTLSTVLYSGQTIAISLEDDLETEGLYAVGEKSAIITNLNRHPVYMQSYDPTTKQNIITARYYDLGKLHFSTDNQSLTISIPNTSP